MTMSVDMSYDLVDILNIGNLPHDEQEVILSEVAELVYKDVVLHALDILPEEMQLELDEEIATADDVSSATLGYFQRTIDGFDHMMGQSLERVLTSMGVMETL